MSLARSYNHEYRELPKLGGYAPAYQSSPSKGVAVKKYFDIKTLNKKEIEDKILALKTWKNNWDGYGSSKPKASSVDFCNFFVQHLCDLVEREKFTWIEPLVSADSDGAVSLEWWRNEKKLTVYFDDESINYIKVTSPNIDEMLEGEIKDTEDLRCAWEWIQY